MYYQENKRVVPQNKRIIENKPRFGQGRAGIRCKKLKLTESTAASTGKSCEIPDIPTT